MFKDYLFFYQEQKALAAKEANLDAVSKCTNTAYVEEVQKVLMPTTCGPVIVVVIPTPLSSDCLLTL